MLLTIGTDVSGSDLGYLLHKNPARVHSFDLPFGKAHVFYPELGTERSEAALLLDVDPVGLVRRRPHDADAGMQYVNDRVYASSSFLSVAMAQVFGTAMSGRSKERQEFAEQPFDWAATITALPCRGGIELLDSLFAPLGYRVEAKHYFLDDKFPEWGPGPYHTVSLKGRVRLRDLLTHIYVLIPVLDSEKHYWVGDDEVEKLLRRGEGWLAGHPARETIVNRYLRYDRKLTSSALARLTEDEASDPESAERSHAEEERGMEGPLRLWEQRLGAVLSAIRGKHANSVIDLGCGEGKLLKSLLDDRSIERIVGMDASWRILEIAAKRLRFEQMPAAQRARIALIHGSLIYRDKRLEGFDAAAVVEVIEHLDPPRLAAFERVVFEHARPKTVVVTTPNAEYNPLFPTLPFGRFRHKDHRFEWTRAQFQSWCAGLAERFGYRIEYMSVGPVDPVVGPPTQMGVFAR